MIRSALRSVSYLVEDVVSVARWVVGEVVAELDYRLQPEHVRQGWAAELADIEAGVDVHEPNAPYLQWGGAGDWPEECSGCHQVRRLDWDSDLCQECLNGPLEGPHYAPYCNRCGYPHPTTQKCLRDATAEDWVRGTAEACGVDPERCVSRLSFEDAESSAVPPTAERPSEVSAAPPSQTPSGGHPLFTTSLLLEQGAVYAEVLAAMEKDEEVAEWHRIDAAAMRERADAFKAVENTT